MNNNVITSLSNIADLCDKIDDYAAKDGVDVQGIMDSVGEIRQEILALAYNIQTIRNQIKIAGKNLTEAFEKVLEPQTKEPSDNV
jgi:nucleoside-triphosphatase THEP1